MGGLLDRFRSQQGEPVICECRRCGTTLSALEIEDEECPHCGPTEVSCVRFQ